MVIEGRDDRADKLLPSPRTLPVVVAHLGETFGGDTVNGESVDLGVDLVVDREHLALLVERVTDNPFAATSLVGLLRQTAHLPVEHGLVAESAVYSMLQGSAEFARWRGTDEPRSGDEPRPVVDVARHAAQLVITLDRPHRHNAITRQLRDELCAALRIAITDDSIASVSLVGRGPSFCSGGDLAEFGIRPDPAVAHRTRVAQSPALLIHDLRDRITAHIHGATLGGGIEIASFAGRLVADPDTRIGLPEVALGLIPGAGGTVGITHRIGRHRTAALALATDTINAGTALAWGLVDAVEAVDPT